MSRKNDGGPIYPGAPHSLSGRAEPGMSLADYYRATAPISLDDAKAACGLPASDMLASADRRAQVFKMLATMRDEYAAAMLALDLEPAGMTT